MKLRIFPSLLFVVLLTTHSGISLAMNQSNQPHCLGMAQKARRVATGALRCTIGATLTAFFGSQGMYNTTRIPRQGAPALLRTFVYFALTMPSALTAATGHDRLKTTLQLPVLYPNKIKVCHPLEYSL